ncbi:MAG TPA: CmcJ/NvfI family oxidoreductase [Steroidobacteraceae bacterium]|nr:CmcJ/NvfI family oxidoreductase [Steroidobacteraceae bacterium]
MPDATSPILGTLGFSEPMTTRPRFHANDNTLDVLNVVPRAVAIHDARHPTTAASLDVEGFRLYPHQSAVKDFRNKGEVEAVHVEEIRRLLLAVSGADQVVVTGAGILRFGERSAESGALNNSRPARFVHIDCSDATAATFYARSRPDNGRRVRRSAQYNVWRAITPPPQDVPLAVCDARSITADDLLPADAIFDRDGAVAFAFEALLLRHNLRQRWFFYSNMGPEEALVFKTNDTDGNCAHCVAHGAFDDPRCPPGVVPRASLEMRGIAYWFE